MSREEARKGGDCPFYGAVIPCWAELLEKEEVDGSANGGAEDDGQDEEEEKRSVGAAAGGDDDGWALRKVARVGLFSLGGLRFGGF